MLLVKGGDRVETGTPLHDIACAHFAQSLSADENVLAFSSATGPSASFIDADDIEEDDDNSDPFPKKSKAAALVIAAVYYPHPGLLPARFKSGSFFPGPGSGNYLYKRVLRV
ncbi:hypothetical protein [Flavihumibacter petaseus]|nr:hypothetical protein [Flavihumibacter petaseus]